MKRLAALLVRLAVLLLGIAALLLRRREPEATAYLGDVQRDDYLWSILSGGDQDDRW